MTPKWHKKQFHNFTQISWHTFSPKGKNRADKMVL
jgi:hypothetical protein